MNFANIARLSFSAFVLITLCVDKARVNTARAENLTPSYRNIADSRALWVVRDCLADPQAINAMIEDATRAGITDLLVQVRGRGDAFYRSETVPRAAVLKHRSDTFDPLKTVLSLAHTKGLRVHAWMNVYLVASESTPVSPPHVVGSYPDWIIRDKHNTSFDLLSERHLQKNYTEGLFLDPGNAHVVNHFVNVVQELVREYAVDGVHLDYVRYPHLDSGYNKNMRRGFEQKYGVDPLELIHNQPGLLRERGRSGLTQLERDWQRYKAGQVTALVRQVRQTVRMTRPGVILSAAVKPDPEKALFRYGQDWTTWLKEDYVDVVAPMMYSTSTSVIREQAQHLVTQVPPERVWAGIAVYNQSVDAASAKIRAVRRAGINGISIFSYNSLPGGGESLTRLTR